MMNTFSLEEMLQNKGYIVYTNIGNSMLPLLRERRDIIEIHKKDSKICCKQYDVVLYKRNGMYVLHRILRILPDGYLIAGDHNTFVERDVTDDMILGVMTRVIRNGKSITPDGFFYKCYVHLWCDCYPVRMWIIRKKQWIRGVLRGVKRRILRSLGKVTNNRKPEGLP